MATQTRGRVRVEDGQKRIRAQIGGVTVADSANVKMVWEIPYYPTYYFPQDSVRMDLLTDSGETKRSPSRGTANLNNITVGDRTVDLATRVWNESKIEDVMGYVSFDWKAMDAWFEEDEEVHVHARDPYTRIDVLPSSRAIRVEVDGVVVAESNRARPGEAVFFGTDSSKPKVFDSQVNMPRGMIGAYSRSAGGLPQGAGHLRELGARPLVDAPASRLLSVLCAREMRRLVTTALHRA